ncbi:MAG TPA: branched-chain amino acid ABC transporter permease [Actinomycetes bacterium]|nr:branched-chain amino acid ABC transporter permease [Actinomycetes bacterium]
MPRRVAIFLATLLSSLVCVIGLGVGTAQAEGESIFGFLRNPEGKELVPVEGAEVTVTGPGGFNETVTTDENGRWTVETNKSGNFEVKLNQDSLPKGVTLRDPDADTLKVPVASGQDKPVLFALGESTRNVQSKWSQAAQLSAEGLRFGLILALAAVGLSLIFGTTGLTNFAHGELVTLGAVGAWWISTGNLPFLPDYGGMNFLVAGALTLIFMGLVGWANDAGLWRPLRRRGTGLIAAMIVSIGLALLLRYFLLYLFSGNTRSYPAYRGQKGLELGPITLSAVDFASMGIAIVVLLAVAYALLRTRIGKATRAVSDNPALAAASGIDVDRVIRVVWVSGSMLAGLAGILLGIAQGINWQTGFQILLLIFAAVTLGGLGTAFGALMGAIVVGMFVTVSTLVIPTELKNVGALGILIVILLVRPQGILGRAQRVG